MSTRLCHTEILPVGHKRQVEKSDNLCQKCLLVAESHLVVQTDLAEKKEKKKINLLSKKAAADD
jgi:hypothetical protein